MGLMLGSCEKVFMKPNPKTDNMSIYDEYIKLVDEKYSMWENPDKELDKEGIFTYTRGLVNDNISEDSLFGVLSYVVLQFKDGHTYLENEISGQEVFYDIEALDEINLDQRVVDSIYLKDDYKTMGSTNYLRYKLLEDGQIGYVELRGFGAVYTNAEMDDMLTYFADTKGIVFDIETLPTTDASKIPPIWQFTALQPKHPTSRIWSIALGWKNGGKRQVAAFVTITPDDLKQLKEVEQWIATKWMGWAAAVSYPPHIYKLMYDLARLIDRPPRERSREIISRKFVDEAPWREVLKYVNGEYSEFEFDLWLSRLRNSGVFSYKVHIAPIVEEFPYIADKELLRLIGKILTHPRIPKVGHNLKFDYKFLKAKWNVEVAPIFADTMLLAYVYDEGFGQGYNLDNLAKSLLNIPDYKASARQKSLLYYNAYDVAITYTLLHKLHTLISEKYPSLKGKLLDLLRFLVDKIPLLADAELTGVPLSFDEVYAAHEKIRRIALRHLECIRRIMGTDEVNTKAFREAFAKMLDFEEREDLLTEKTHQLSLKSENLEKILERTHDSKVKQVAISLSSLQILNKLESSFVRKYPSHVNPATGRIHPSFMLTGTVTGRLASKEPNFQQIPKHDIVACEKCGAVFYEAESCKYCGGKVYKLFHVKEFFKAPPGRKYVMADYSQVEVRVLAHVTGDTQLIEAIKRGLDFHSYVLSVVRGIPYQEIVEKKETDKEIKKLRSEIKKVVFGIIYGQNAAGLADELKIPVEEAEQLRNQFFSNFPAVKEWVERQHALVKQYRFVATPLRIRRFVVVDSKALRQAQNFPIQSLASDICLEAASRLRKRFLKEKIDAVIVGLIHDAIVADVAEKDVDRVVELFHEVMEKEVVEAFGLKVPLTIDLSVSDTLKE